MKYFESNMHLSLNYNQFSIFSTNDNPFYYFFLPLTSLMWIKCGYKPLVFLFADQNKWKNKQYIIDLTLQLGGNIAFIDNSIVRSNPDLRKYKQSSLAQVSRLCPNCFPDVSKEEYCLTSDIDMLPLDRKWLNSQDRTKPVNIFFANAYNHKRYNICYIDMKKQMWKNIMGHRGDDLCNNLTNLFKLLHRRANIGDQWNFDEQCFSKKIRGWSGYPHNCNMINWPVRKNTGFKRANVGVPMELPIGRLDRSNWEFNSNINYRDAHCKRPAYIDSHWKEILELLKFYISNEELEIIKKYRDKFIQMETK